MLTFTPTMTQNAQTPAQLAEQELAKTDNSKPSDMMPVSKAKEEWEMLQRQAIAYSKSTLVPKSYQGPNGVSDCIIALDMAARMGANPLMVMQHLYVVQGRPAWSATFLVSCINQCGRYDSLQYEERGKVEDITSYAVRAFAHEKSSGKRLDGTWITWDMVTGEKWLDKPGSKWKTMPEQMFKYRAAAFWQRVYAPEIGMGFATVEEAHDIATEQPKAATMTVSLSKAQLAQYVQEVKAGADADEVIESLESRLGMPLPAYQKKQIKDAGHEVA